VPRDERSDKQQVDITTGNGARVVKIVPQGKRTWVYEFQAVRLILFHTGPLRSFALLRLLLPGLLPCHNRGGATLGTMLFFDEGSGVLQRCPLECSGSQDQLFWMEFVRVSTALVLRWVKSGA